MITVLLFAQLQEQAGKEKIIVEADDLKVSELKALLESSYKLSQLDHVMTAINEEYALPTDNIFAGDTVALIPPVSGG
ncbi:MoaD/ThiS family protein [Ornithinibacillus contaminans]|uniref:MoaD/ThiS family protein n=1 Tax=Ornithinibacillus contaminans TaxID=694055 RepID=UPI00064D9038|nr:MoaD/ThiS family protein [Ornithinibacillus contaminans]